MRLKLDLERKDLYQGEVRKELEKNRKELEGVHSRKLGKRCEQRRKVSGEYKYTSLFRVT